MTTDELRALALAATQPHTHMDEDGFYECDACAARQDLRDAGPSIITLLRVIDVAKAMRESMYEGLETIGELEQEWSKQDRELIDAFDAALAKLEGK